MGDDLNEAGKPVERFGLLELVLSESNLCCYKDVYHLKHRKKNLWQAKIWRLEHKDHRQPGLVSQCTFSSCRSRSVPPEWARAPAQP